jgi:superoxide dismutase, Cu-Zn family
MRRLAALAITLLLLAACATKSAVAVFNPAPPRTAWIVAQDGRPIGQAAFTEAPNGVLIRLEFSEHALPAGWHGVHMHQIGDCSDFAAGFQASGVHEGHVAGVSHGLMNPAGPEAGDLPNLFAPPAGAFGAEFYSTRLTLASFPKGDRMPLLDGNGSALIVHAGPDDHTSQPIGGAGARLACAALTPLP